MNKVGLYLAGGGSLDGSDIFTAVLAFEEVQAKGGEPVPVARDVEMGEVVNHRFAYEESGPRNSLDESARLVRGDIADFRDVDTDELDGAVLVGGGGVLSTWTDYHERGNDCRITERLKFHVHEYHQQSKPILALDNTPFAIAVAFREQDLDLTLNPGSSTELRSAVEQFGMSVTDQAPSVDEDNRIICLPDLTAEFHLPTLRQKITDALGTVVSMKTN